MDNLLDLYYQAILSIIANSNITNILTLISWLRTWKLLLHTWMYSANMPKEKI